MKPQMAGNKAAVDNLIFLIDFSCGFDYN